MAAYFFDSSALVKEYTHEVGTAWVKGLCDPAAGHDLVVARITGVEVVSALVRHVPPLLPAHLNVALALFQGDFPSRFRVVAVDHRLIIRAMNLAIHYRLRGYDAVQLAAALRARARYSRAGLPAPVIVSADAALNTAAAAEGLTVDDPNTHP